MKLSDNAEIVLKKRYYINNEDWDGLCHRVANGLGSSEQEKEEFFKAMNDLKFLPNSPTLMNASTELNNLSACHVLPVDDSMNSIMDTAKNMAILFQSGGGVGVAMDNIREKDSMVKSTSGAASGVVSFMELYNTVANVVRQGGRRRAALMLSLRVDHPEILDFIDCKSDKTKLNNCNISVAITDDFMKKAEAGQEYDLISPVNGKVGKLNARDVLLKIAKNAHQTGEPGILFIDTANNADQTPQFGKYETTNPCITGETLVALADGRNTLPIKELAEIGDDVLVYATDIFGKPIIKMMRHPRKTGKKSILKITFEDGNIIRVTKNHKLRTISGRYIEADKLCIGDYLPVINIFNDNGTRIVTGNSMQTPLSSTELITEYNQTRPKERYYTYNNDDFVIKNCEICNQEFMAKYNQREQSVCSVECGKRLSEGKEDFEIYQNGFHDICKTKIISIEPDGKEDVYNGTVDDVHNYYTAFEFGKGHLTCINNMNCGEQFLRPNSSCNLLSINLNNVTEEELEYYTRLAVRFLNAVIFAGKFPLDLIKETVQREKNIGLGIMGWSDYLAKKMLPYDSQAGRNEAERIMKLIAGYAHSESMRIGKEKNEYIATKEGLRYNSTLTCVAPTGTISMIADCSSGIEPFFSLSYNKNVMDGHSLKYFNPVLKETLKKEGLWCSEVKAQIAKTGSIQNIDTIPQSIKDVFKTANEISALGQVKMQAAFQKYIHNSISKTVNLSSSATVDDVLLAFLTAYRLGCKGLTVYRDNSRSNKVLTSTKSKTEKCPECSSKDISHDSGCISCKSCGWSACSVS